MNWKDYGNVNEFEGHTPGPWYRNHHNDTIRSEPLELEDDPEAYLFDIVGATTTDAELAAAAPELFEAIKRLRKERGKVIEYVKQMTATPHVLKKLMGSPSQVHTIDNLAAGLDQLLNLLRGEEE